ncbi:MAG: hypothetical protein A2511_04255 [Deltaproteobacteria bacterium RIFOXYD12_FULL_50_9]|nr:MAG: hypothetical protein A2511_04255 [Deltaproteobacteria bacterium RIFOXYD12_FULL_50_9]
MFFGLIAAGKSSLAAAWAQQSGFVWLNSDRVRKDLAGLPPRASRLESVDQGIYSQEFTRRTYDALLEQGAGEIRASRSVVLDASYQSMAERQRVRDLAGRLGVRVCFILCVCPESEMERRMAERARDPLAVSDGRWEIYLRQKERFEAPTELSTAELITINTEQPVTELLPLLKKRIEVLTCTLECMS